MTLLSKRDYPSGELADKLANKFGQAEGISAPLIESVVGWVIELGYVNDARYCQLFVASSANKGRGRLRIQQELRQKKLAGDLIDNALAGHDIDWQALALETLQRKHRMPPSTPNDKAKAIRFLQYRGFYPEEVYAAVHSWEQSDLSNEC